MRRIPEVMVCRILLLDLFVDVVVWDPMSTENDCAPESPGRPSAASP